jgi:hypothetical protein
MSIMICHTATCITSHVVGNLTMVGRAATMYSVKGGLINAHTWIIGLELTQFDTDAYALAQTVEALAEFYSEEVIPPQNLFLLSNSASALQAIKNPRSAKAHTSALRFHKVLMLLTLQHRHLSYYLVWAPTYEELEGFRMAQDLAKEASWQLPPDSMDHIQTTVFQKDRASSEPFTIWR